MARARTVTKLSLDRWAQIIGINPLHFSQVQIEPPTVCAQPWMQYEWQDVDRVGREAIARAILDAESAMERYLGYRLLPSWEVNEWRPTVRHRDPALFNVNAGIREQPQVVFPRWRHVIAGGVERKDLVEAASAIVYSDADADLYFETATTTSPVTFTDPCQVAVYYPGKAGEAAWEIRPVAVSIAGGVATITFRREQAVLEALMEGLMPQALDGLDNANFLTTVDVYRRWNDPQQQATLLWGPFAGGCCTDGCEGCAYSAQTACLVPMGDPYGVGGLGYQPATWDATANAFTPESPLEARAPDLVRVYYYSGYENRSLACPRRDMDDALAQAVAYFSASLLDRPICECNNVRSWIEHWRADLAAEPPEGTAYKLAAKHLGSPFGTKRGALYAWEYVKANTVGSGGVVA